MSTAAQIQAHSTEALRTEADTTEREFRDLLYLEMARLVDGTVLLDDLSDRLWDLATRIRVRYGTQDAAGEMWAMFGDLDALELADEVSGD